MINVTARTESSPQTLGSWPVYQGNYWWDIRAVGWISQNSATRVTTLYFKWQTGSYNYWPYWNDAHQYTVAVGSETRATSFNLAQDSTNTYKDKSSVMSIPLYHNADGTYSGTIRINGYKCWEAFSLSDIITVPSIEAYQPTPEPEPEPTPTPEPEPEEEPIEAADDGDPKYYILADGNVLYASNDEDYWVLNPKLSLSLNQVDNLTFTLPPNHPMYDSLAKLRTTVEVRQGTETLFRGRVLNDSKDFYNRKEVYCEGALSFLNDTVMAPYAKGDYTTAESLLTAALEQHYEQVPSSIPERRLKFSKCDVSANIEVENTEYSNTNDVISTLLNDVGGYLKLEYYSNGETGLSYLNSYNRVSTQAIEFGKNLLDLTQSIEASDVYTSVLCLGKKDDETGKRLTTGDGDDIFIEDQNAINVFGRIIRIFTYDDITDRAELIKTAQTLLAVGTAVTLSFEIKAFDLHLIDPEINKFRLGDSIPIKAYPQSVDSYIQCSAIDLDLQNPENTTYTLGGTITALTDTTSKK